MSDERIAALEALGYVGDDDEDSDENEQGNQRDPSGEPADDQKKRRPKRDRQP